MIAWLIWPLIVLGLLAANLAVYRHSRALGLIFLAGICLRFVGGLFLFAISQYQWPLFTELQAGSGFWTLAIDAQSYFAQATTAVREGLGTIPDSGPSPGYVRVLAAWMLVSGVSPVSALFLNIVWYAITILIAVRAALPDFRAALFSVSAVSFSPALLLFGTQALKDTFGVLLIALAFAGIRLWIVDSTSFTRTRSAWLRAAGAALLIVAVYFYAGVRAYYSLFIILGTVTVAAMCVVRQRRRFVQVLLLQVALVSTLWFAFMAGGRAYYPYYLNVIRATFLTPAAPLHAVEQARHSFVDSGGQTATVLQRVDPPVEQARHSVVDSGGQTATVLQRVDPRPRLRLLKGTAILLTPISLLRIGSVVDFPGGRGLLTITDIDTLMVDVSLIAFIYLFATSHARLKPVAVFGLLVGGLSALSMAYVVTNYGTLFRLRLLATAPFWLMPAFLAQIRNDATAY